MSTEQVTLATQVKIGMEAENLGIKGSVDKNCPENAATVVQSLFSWKPQKGRMDTEGGRPRRNR